MPVLMIANKQLRRPGSVAARAVRCVRVSSGAWTRDNAGQKRAAPRETAALLLLHDAGKARCHIVSLRRHGADAARGKQNFRQPLCTVNLQVLSVLPVLPRAQCQPSLAISCNAAKRSGAQGPDVYRKQTDGSDLLLRQLRLLLLQLCAVGVKLDVRDRAIAQAWTGEPN